MHMDELIKFARIVQGFFEKQFQVLGMTPNSTKYITMSKGLGAPSGCQNKC